MDIRKVFEDIKSGRVKKVILDTDTGNEVDDQFAIAYAIASEKTEVLSINAAPFTHADDDIYAEGMEQSYKEIKRVLAAYKKDCDIPVFKGSTESMEKNGGVPVDSPAARNIIDTALASDEPIYVIGIGTASNIASAIMMCPEIKEKIVVVWQGGNALDCEHLGEYNLVQDYVAGQVLLDSGVPLVLLPAWGVTSVLYTLLGEFERELKGKSPVCELLWQLMNEYYHGANKPGGYGRTIWDIASVATLSVPECGTFKIIPAPIFSEERVYKFDDSRHEIIYLEKIDRDTVYADTWKNIRSLECTGEYIPRWSEDDVNE